MIMKLGMKHYVLKLYKVYINNDPELTLTNFTAMSNVAKLVLYLYSRHRYQVSVYRTIGQNQNQNSSLVKRQNDNTSPGDWPRKISP